MEMHDLGIEHETCQLCPSGEGKGEKEKHYPSVDLTSTQIPSLTKKQIGSNVSLHLVGKIKGIREQKMDDKVETRYEIELREGGEMGRVSSAEYMNMSEEEKDEKDEKDMKEKAEE